MLHFFSIKRLRKKNLSDIGEGNREQKIKHGKVTSME